MRFGEITGAVTDGQRAPRSGEFARQPGLRAVGQADQLTGERSGPPGPGGESHTRVVDQRRLVHHHVPAVRRDQGERGLRGLDLGQRGPPVVPLVGVPVAPRRQRPTRGGRRQRELGPFGGDRAGVEPVLRRQAVTETDAVVEDPDDQVQPYPARGLHGPQHALPGMVADQRVGAPHRAPRLVDRPAFDGLHHQSAGERRQTGQVEPEPGGGHQDPAPVHHLVAQPPVRDANGHAQPPVRRTDRDPAGRRGGGPRGGRGGGDGSGEGPGEHRAGGGTQDCTAVRLADHFTPHYGWPGTGRTRTC